MPEIEEDQGAFDLAEHQRYIRRRLRRRRYIFGGAGFLTVLISIFWKPTIILIGTFSGVITICEDPNANSFTRSACSFVSKEDISPPDVTTPAKANLLTIYVGQLDGDTPSRSVRADIIDSLRDYFIKDTIQVLPAAIHLKVDNSFDMDKADEAVQSTARDFLIKNGGDFLVFGRVSIIGSSAVPALRFIGINTEYGSYERLALDDKHLADPHILLAYLLYAMSFVDTGMPLTDEVRQKYRHYISVVTPIVSHPADGLAGTVIAQLARTLGLIEIELGKESGNVEMLESAKNAFQQEYDQYASIKDATGITLSRLDIARSFQMIGVYNGDRKSSEISIDILNRLVKNTANDNSGELCVIEEYLGEAYFTAAFLRQNDGTFKLDESPFLLNSSRNYYQKSIDDKPDGVDNFTKGIYNFDLKKIVGNSKAQLEKITKIQNGMSPFD